MFNPLINLVGQLPSLPVDQLRLPRPDKSRFVMTENVSPSPYPLPSRARGYKKNILLKGEGVSEESPLEGGRECEKGWLSSVAHAFGIIFLLPPNIRPLQDRFF